MLEQSGIAHYLLSLGLVKPQDVIEEDLTVVDASRRNTVFVVATTAGPTYVVKQGDPQTATTLAHEAAVLQVLATFDELAQHVPRVVHHDVAARRLVLSTPAGTRDWGDNHAEGRYPRSPARVLGRVLATLHQVPAECVEDVPPGIDPMWGLSLPELPRAMVLALSAGAHDLVRRVQGNTAVCERLAALQGARAGGGLMHGDVRWTNCLAVPAPGSRRRTGVILVDWELAGRGAAAFDVGAVVAEYLLSWTGSIPIVDPADPGRLSAQARHPLARMESAVQAFWSAYVSAMPECPPLRSVMELAAVRLLQAAVEQAQRMVTATAEVGAVVQLAEHMLRHPELVAYTLLGLRE